MSIRDLDAILRMMSDDGREIMKKSFMETVGLPGNTFVVAHLPQEVVGYTFYRRRPGDLELIDLIVDKEHRGRGLGRQIVDFIVQRYRHSPMRTISTILPETLFTSMGVFLSKCGFRACPPILRDHFVTPSGTYDGFRMIYTYGGGSVSKSGAK